MQRFIFTLLLSLSAIQCGLAESNLRVASASHQRRELSWSSFWNNFMTKLHPLGPKHHSYSGGSSSNSANTSEEGDGADVQDANEDGSYVVSSEVKAYYDGDNNGGDGSSIQYSDYDSSSSYSFVNGQGNGGASANSVNAKNSAGLWIFVAAAMVAGVIGAAIVVSRVSIIRTDI